ncbi:MAG TPA: hypothetical protein VFU98_05740 [Microlunatus sp.]|nr:hypothetical protein [Microlunatus sp.]
MTIDWGALGVVAVVSIVVTLVFVALLSAGIRLVSEAAVEVDRGQQAQHATIVRSAGYALLGLAGLVVLFGIYLIVK